MVSWILDKNRTPKSLALYYLICGALSLKFQISETWAFGSFSETAYRKVTKLSYYEKKQKTRFIEFKVEF